MKTFRFHNGKEWIERDCEEILRQFEQIAIEITFEAFGSKDNNIYLDAIGRFREIFGTPRSWFSDYSSNRKLLFPETDPIKPWQNPRDYPEKIDWSKFPCIPFHYWQGENAPIGDLFDPDWRRLKDKEVLRLVEDFFNFCGEDMDAIVRRTKASLRHAVEVCAVTEDDIRQMLAMEGQKSPYYSGIPLLNKLREMMKEKTNDNS
jgi:hypothetical protein